MSEINIFVLSKDWDFTNIFCESSDETGEDGEKFVRLADVATLTKERDFWMAQFREMAQAQPYAAVEWTKWGEHQTTPGLDTYKWFWWNSTARPIYKGALCDVVLSDGSIHLNVPPDFNWNDQWDKPCVVAARHGPNLDFMEDVDRPAPIVYEAYR